MRTQINMAAAALCLASLAAAQANAGAFGTYEEDGSLFRSALNAEPNPSAAAKFESKKNSKDAVQIGRAHV